MGRIYSTVTRYAQIPASWLVLGTHLVRERFVARRRKPSAVETHVQQVSPSSPRMACDTSYLGMTSTPADYRDSNNTTRLRGKKHDHSHPADSKAAEGNEGERSHTPRITAIAVGKEGTGKVKQDVSQRLLRLACGYDALTLVMPYEASVP